jgi:hypothetical protein
MRNCQPPSKLKWRNPFAAGLKIKLNLPYFFTVFFIIQGLFFSTAVAQTTTTFPPASSCTSGDLILVGATLPGSDLCNTCVAGLTTSRTLYLSINNKTGSTRTSFAFWGTLEIYNADGTKDITKSITGCSGPIISNKVNTLPFGTISYKCGQSLKITNLFLAWTDANAKSTCANMKSATINPKCGTLPSIQIFTGLDASAVVTNATCTTGGSIVVTPFGGKAPFSVTIGSDTRVVVTGSTTFMNLPPATYTINLTDANICTASKSRIVGSASAVTTNAGLDFTKTCISNTSGGTIGETAESGYTYSWTSSPVGFISTVSNPTVNPSVTTTYTVNKTNIMTGCRSTDAVTVTVNNAAVTADAGSDFTKTCVANASGGIIGETAVLGYTYSWTSSPAGFTSALSNPTVNPSITTTYNVTKTNNTTGCSNTDAVTVTVNNDAVTADAGSDFTKTCVANASGGIIGETAVFGYTYSWTSSPAGFTSAVSNPTVNPSVTTTYTVAKTNNTTGCSNTDAVTVTVNNDAVTVDAGSDFTKTCVANASGGIIGETAVLGYTYSWTSSPAGFTSALSNPTVNPSVTTTYTVTKTNNTTGCSNTDAVTVTVNNAAVTADAGSDFTKTCVANASGGIIGETAVFGYTYSWTSSPAGFTSALSNPTVNPSVSTTYTVTKTNNTTGCSNTDAVTVTVNNAAVTANAGSDFTKTCVANTSGGTIGEVAVFGYTYSWTSSPAGFTSAVSNLTVNPSVTTTYTVTKTNNTTGCSNTDAVMVTVNNAAVTANAGSDFTKTCVANTSGGTIGEAAVFGYTYSWTSSPAGFTSALSNPTVNPSVTTTYTVTKTNNTTGCSNADAVTVIVNNAAVTANAGSDFTKTCVANTSGGTIGEAAVLGYTYSWTSSPAGFTSALSNPTVNPSVTTTYTVAKTNNTTGCSNTDQVTVTVDIATPDAPTICVVQPSLCGPTTGSVTILSPTGGGFEYSIDNGGNWQSGTVFSSLAPGSVTGIKVKKLSSGCISAAANCDGSYCTTQTSARTSINSGSRSTNISDNITESPTTVKAYPNPFSDKVKFVVTSSLTGKGNLEVYNINGQKLKTVYTGFISTGSHTFELSLPIKQISNLVYVLRIGDKKITGQLLQINQ